MLASKFHAGTGGITRSPVTTRVMHYQCNTVLLLVQCSHSQSQPTDLFVYLFIYLVSYWACRSSVTSRCVVG